MKINEFALEMKHVKRDNYDSNESCRATSDKLPPPYKKKDQPNQINGLKSIEIKSAKASQLHQSNHWQRMPIKDDNPLRDLVQPTTWV